MTSPAEPASLDWQQLSSGAIALRLAGDWRFADALPADEPLLKRLGQAGPGQLQLVDAGLGQWDSALIAFLVKLARQAEQAGLNLDGSRLPAGVQRLLRLALAVPEQTGERRRVLGIPILTRIGCLTIELHRTWWDAVSFLGEVCLALLRLLRGRFRFRPVDLVVLLEQCGAQALPIVTLISVLSGMILAFVGAVQLEMFGAQIFVANLVTLGMAREMGAMMTGIIMAGRTGAAFAAQLGTMQVNDELDALRTLGIPPVDFLVLPRLLALTVMMPLLCIYSIFMGVFGGAIVSAGMLDISFFEYFTQARTLVGLSHFIIGVTKSGVYGVVVALSGCLRGLQCGRSASSVGFATTSAVVTAIVWIVVSDAVITVLCKVFDL